MGSLLHGRTRALGLAVAAGLTIGCTRDPLDPDLGAGGGGGGTAGSGGADSGGQGGGDATGREPGNDLPPPIDRPPDVAPDVRPDVPPGGSYGFVVIYDREKIDCSLTTGPGSDIDAVELKSGATTVGVGMKGSGLFGPGMMACTKCGAGGGACLHTGKVEQATVEGPRDAVIYKSKVDTGYISLNTGAVQVQIGDSSGAGPPADIRKGDTIVVHEVDRTYAGDPAHDPDNVCKCDPEKYEVFVFKAKADGKIDAMAAIKLVPGDPDPKNKAACDMMSKMPGEGCGTTTFVVP